MWVLHANEKQVLMGQMGEGQDFWKDYLTNRWCLRIWQGRDSEPLTLMSGQIKGQFLDLSRMDVAPNTSG